MLTTSKLMSCRAMYRSMDSVGRLDYAQTRRIARNEIEDSMSYGYSSHVQFIIGDSIYVLW